jgi:multiple sugar transport system substrate-binding protein
MQFSICGADWVAAKTQAFIEPLNSSLPAVARFQVVAVPWAEYKQEYTRMAIYSRGVDVSQVGAPVANDLQAMNALRPFSKAELNMLGGESAFISAAWEQSNRVADGSVWTLPWLIDPRGFLYWRDMFETAGIDEQSAFTSFENTLDTLQRLKVAGQAIPLVIPLGNQNIAGQASCSWVWGAGGDFVSPDGRKALFTQQPCVDGLTAHFRMAPYLYHEADTLQITEDVNDLFITRRAAILYGGMWPVAELIEKPNHPLRSRLGLARLPGPGLNGGSSLAIWNFTRYEQEAFKLVHFLLDQPAQVAYYPLWVNHLPARADALTQHPFSTDPILQGFIQLAHNGRAFPNIKLCGLLEGFYNAMITRIWTQIATNPGLDLEVLVHHELTNLERRFQGWVG